MEIILSKVRKAPNRDDFKATLQYVRKDGKKVTRSQFFPTREIAKNRLNFWIGGLTSNVKTR